MRIGVLRVQGAFAEHEAVLRGIGAEAVPVRLPEHLEGLAGLRTNLPDGVHTAGSSSQISASDEVRRPRRAPCSELSSPEILVTDGPVERYVTKASV